jgi:hypothetical protein
MSGGMTRRGFGSRQESISLAMPVQELDPVNREGDGHEILFHLSFEEVGPHFA